MSVLPACEPVHHVGCLIPSKKRGMDLPKLKLQMVVSSLMGAGKPWVLLKSRQGLLLTTEPSLQTLFNQFLRKVESL